MTEKEPWPFFGTLKFRNPIFKMESHTIYIDFPHESIVSFLDEIDKLCQDCNNDVESAYQQAVQLKDAYNIQLKLPFFKFIIRKESFGKKPLGIQIKIYWDKFLQYLEAVATGDLSLEAKYNTLSQARADLGKMKELNPENIRIMVERKAFTDIQSICSELEQFINDINKIRTKLRQKFLIRKKIDFLTFSYLFELISILRIIVTCVNQGTIPTAYREMRKILESASWVILDDLLRLSQDPAILNQFETPIPRVSRSWYDWAQRNQAILPHWGRLKDKLNPIKDRFYEMSQNSTENCSKSAIERIFIAQLTYPLLLLISPSIETQLDDDRMGFVPQYEVSKYKLAMISDLEHILTVLKGVPSSESEKATISELVNTTLGETKKLIAPYFSNKFVLDLVDNMLDVQLNSLYGRYSFFVHSYDRTWQYFPYSSVLEFKIFKNEVHNFVKEVSKTLKAYTSKISAFFREK